MEGRLSCVFKPTQISFHMFGVFVVWTKTNRTFWLLHALLILTSLVFLTFPSVIECAYVFIAVSDSSTAGGFNFLKILDEARYAVDRVHKLVLFLFVVFHQKALSQLPDTMCNVLQHLNASDADIISLRRKLVKWLTVLVGALVTLFLIPETFTQVMRTIEEATAVSESNQRTLNSTFNVKVNYYWFYWLMKGNLVPMRFVSHLTKVHGAIFVITIMSALVLFIGTLTHLVEIHLRNANDLSKQLKHWNNLKLKGSNATLSTEALLTFRRQTRLLTEFAEQLSVVLGPMIVIATASNLAMLLGSIGWVFDGYTLLSDPLRHGSWLAFVVARGVIASNLCITSTEKADLFVIKEKQLVLEYDEYYAEHGMHDTAAGRRSYSLGRSLLDPTFLGLPAVSLAGLGPLRKESMFAVLSTCAGVLLFLYQSNYK